MKSRLEICFILAVSLFFFVFPIAYGADLGKIDIHGNTDDYIGASVFVSGNYAIISADGDDEKGDGAGAAYIYYNQGGNWTQQAKVTANDGKAADKFGTSVAISSDSAVVGASYYDEDGKKNSGAVYIFNRESGHWIQSQILTASDSAQSDFFGSSVSVAGDYAVIGAPYDDDKGAESGSVYVFKYDGTRWIQQAKLTGSDGAKEDFFGTSVSVSDKYIIVGAHLHNNSISNTSFGAAYIFKRPSDGWSVWAKLSKTEKDELTYKLTADDGDTDDYFGRAVSISGDYAIVGAYGDNNNAGSAYMFKRADDKWKLNAKLTADTDENKDKDIFSNITVIPLELSPHDYFGSSVSLSGEYTIIGAYGDDEKGSKAGSAYIFRLKNGTWKTEGDKLTANDGSANDYLGKSVAISGINYIIGASGNNNNTGTAYIYGTPIVTPTIEGITENEVVPVPMNAETDITFTVTDVDTPATDLNISYKSSNTSVIPLFGLNISETTQISESETRYTLSVRPAETKEGDSEITLTVRDDKAQEDSVKFTIKVTSTEPPSIEWPDDLDDSVTTIYENSETQVIEFQISDETTSAGKLITSHESSNTDLVPNDDDHIKIECEDNGDCTLKIIPVPGEFGTADITVIITDEYGYAATETFTLTVISVPKIEGLSNKSMDEDTTETINFTVYDEGGADDLEVAASWMSVDMSEGKIVLDGSGAERSLKITPPHNESGEARITVGVRNRYGAVSSDSFVLEVNDVNDWPTISGPENRNITINENSSKTILFDVQDIDDPQSSLSTSATSDNAEVISDENMEMLLRETPDDEILPALKITPKSDQDGIAKITVTVNDGKHDCKDPYVFTVQVNAPPTIVNDLQNTSTNEDEQAVIAIEVDDKEDPVSSLRLYASADDPFLIPDRDIRFTGSGENRKLIITPAHDKTGETEITVTVKDTNDAKTQKRFFLTVNPVNDSPTISQITSPQQGLEDSWTEIPFWIEDPEGGMMTLSVESKYPSLFPMDGDHIDINNSGSYTGYPVYLDSHTRTYFNLKLLSAEDMTGSAAIVVTVKDDEEGGLEAKTQFVITVGETNDPPVISDIGNQNAKEDALSSEIPFTVQDMEGGILTVSVSSNNPGLVQNENITVFGLDSENQIEAEADEVINLSLTIQPETNMSGTARITVTAHDGEFTSKPVNFTFKVEAENDPPKVYDITPQSTDEDEETDPPIIIKVSDPEGGRLTVSVSPDKPALVPNDDDHININNFGSADYPINTQPGVPVELDLTLLPEKNQSGKTKITVTVTDENNESDTTQFFFSVNIANDPPMISGIGTDYSTDEDTLSEKIPFKVSDMEGGELTISVTSSDPWLIPDENITIIGTDENNKVLTEADEEASLSLTLLPLEDQSGTATITISADDGESTSDPAVFTFTVNGANDGPNIYDIGPQTTTEETPTEPISIAVMDREGGQLTISAASSDPDLVPNDNAHININEFGSSYLLDSEPGELNESLELVISPAKNQWGKAVITVTAKDEEGVESKTQFILTVNGAPDKPIISRITDQSTPEETPKPISFTVSDMDGGELTVSASSDNPALIPDDHIDIGGDGTASSVVVSAEESANVSMTITPADDMHGSSFVTVTVEDAEGNISEEIFEFTVEAENDPPVISGIPIEMIIDEDTPLKDIAPIEFSVSDPDGGLLTITVSSSEAPVPDDDDHINIGNADGSFFGKKYKTVVSPTDGANLRMRIIPDTNEYGISEITVTVEDDEGAKAEDSFFFKVDPLNDPPMIEEIGPQTTDKGEAINIEVNVSDDETSANDLLVSASWNLFGLTEDSLSNLEEDVPEDTIVKLRSLKNRIYTSENEFVQVLEITIGTDQTGQYRTLILENVESGGSLDVTDFGATRTLTITPPDKWAGNAVVTVRAEDDDESPLATEQRFTLTVNQVNTKPEIIINSVETREEDGGPYQFQFTVKDDEGGLMPIKITSSNQQLVPEDYAHINVSDGLGNFGPDSYELNLLDGEPEKNLTLIITPVLDGYGETTLTITVEDSDMSESEEMHLIITPLNDTPWISLIGNQWTNEETPSDKIPFSVKDTDGGELTITVTSSDTGLVPEDAAHIMITDAAKEFGDEHTITTSPNEAANLSLTITPAPGAGTADITVTVRDKDHKEASSTFTFMVNDLDEPPTIWITPNPPDPVPEGETVEVQVRVRDDRAGALKINVESVDNTELVPNSYPNLMINEQFGPEYLQPVEAGTDAVFTIQITPIENKAGVAKISVTVDDDETIAVTKEFNVTVYPVDQTTPPEIQDISNPSMEMNISGEPQAGVDVSFWVKDAEGGTLEISVTAATTDADPPGATLVPNDISHININGFGNTHTIHTQPDETASLTLKLTPAPGISGVAEITVKVKDTDNLETSETFILMVSHVNEPPVISADSFSKSIDEDEQNFTLDFTVSDKEGGNLIITAEPSEIRLVPYDFDHISIGDSTDNYYFPTYPLTLSANGSQNFRLKVIPETDEYGMTIITVTADDGFESAEEKFYLTVRPVNDIPGILNLSDNYITKEDTSGSEIKFTVDDNETQADDLLVSASWVSPASPRGAVIAGGSGANRTVAVTPPTDWFGDATINIRVEDENAASAEASFTLTVEPVNDKPVVSSIESPQTTERDTPVTIAFTLSDVDTPLDDLIITGKSSDPRVVPNDNAHIAFSGSGASRVLSVTPASYETGSSTITIMVRDGGDTVETEFTLDVTPSVTTTVPPRISGISTPKITDEDKPVVIHFTVSDEDTSIEKVQISRQSLNAMLVPYANLIPERVSHTEHSAEYSLTIIPAQDLSGDAIIRLVADDTENSTSVTFTLTVNPVNDEPVINDGFDIGDRITDEGEPVTVTFSVDDVETPTEALMVNAVSSNNSLIPNSEVVLRCSEGDCSSYTLTATPVPDKSGLATITISVTDDSLAINSAVTQDFVIRVGSSVIKWDIDNNGIIDMRDAVLIMDILTGGGDATPYLDADVNGDGKIGLEELIFMLRQIGGLNSERS
ncbi:tandem-95 repeat protein [Desulfonema magnum]|uniref:FG-GAP repeat-containing protein n=1 Tax=Desulfonema magnum TaxID=45655 RepID=A0A975BR08_9BACT|nr:tandem-95 repeat protein [Desulfonema magnum]QTA89975.1 FG-GAP repeat-containing protein [Desulfonema magnum]